MAFLQLVPLALSASILGLLALLFRRRKPLSFLQGPPVSSWLLGHEYELTNQREVGDLEFKWFQDYGTVFRGAGCCGEETLMVSDVDALHHILNTGGYRYPKTKDDERSSEQITGRGLAWAQGATHKRHRKALNPAFTESQLRTFVPLFQMYADKLALRWRERFADSQIIDVSKWLQNTTLDVLGESTFGFHFEALDDKASDFQISIQKIFANSRQPFKLMTLWRTWKRLLPDPVVDYIASAYVTEEDVRFKSFLELAKGSARDSLARKGLNADGEKRSNNQSNMRGVEGKKDILNMLLRSMEDPKKRLDEDEVLSQVSTMLFAGYELTAMTLTWILYELSRNLNDQRRLRGEIDAILAEKGKNAMLTANDYDSMPFLNACVKEGLRLRPGVQFTTREADLDDVIPLAQPVISTSGEMLKKIPVIKGQRVHISIAAYNRSPSIWGSDSDQWNPSRFLRLESTKQQSSIGVFGNVLSFGSGVRGCIGWRFAVIEMQAILVGLLSQFEFQIPPAGLDIHAVPLKTMNVPMVRGELDKGLQMPLVVKRRSIS
ncbi:cytochrome P450 [Rhodocollybia butyracea]|uniref:Cytochrome P450 n=1 Tax=Rhodocollybia butyracea TaxID=206335 RepID=A0A9P5Q5D2_9AGAR|nr:cytochrome P450 [Rhodocollybia butyracea]